MHIFKPLSLFIVVVCAAAGLTAGPANSATLIFAPASINLEGPLNTQDSVNFSIVFDIANTDFVQSEASSTDQSFFGINFLGGISAPFGDGLRRFTENYTVTYDTEAFLGTRTGLASIFFGIRDSSDIDITVELFGTGTAPTASAVPLPAALPLFLTGLAGIGLLRRRQRQQQV